MCSLPPFARQPSSSRLGREKALKVGRPMAEKRAGREEWTMDGRPTWKKKKGGRRSEGGRDGRQEKGKKEKQPTSKSNQTVLFILPLFHPNCPPPSSPRFRVLHPPGQSVKRGNGEKRRGSPSVFLPLAIVLSRRRGRRGHEIFKHSIWLRCLSSFPFLLSFHPLSTGRKEKQGGGETGQHRETSPLSFPSASNSPTPAAAAR